MNKYLVVSYDPDEQQWHYDVVFAESEDTAKERLLQIRRYCIDADAIDMTNLQRMARNVLAETQEDAEKWLEEIRAEAA